HRGAPAYHQADEPAFRQFQRVLPVLSERAPQSDLPTAAFRRQRADRGAGRAGRAAPAVAVVAAGGAGDRLRLRLGRALLLRAQPAVDVHLPVLQPSRRLGDVPRHAHRADPFLMAGADRDDAAAIAAVLAFWSDAGAEHWFGKDDDFDARFKA